MRFIMLVFYLVLIVFGVSFAVLNASKVALNLYVIHFQIPVSLLVTISLGIGALIGAFIFLMKYWRLKVEHHRIKHQLKLKEKEINNLRAIPLKDDH